jgi:hypothetical protein
VVTRARHVPFLPYRAVFGVRVGERYGGAPFAVARCGTKNGKDVRHQATLSRSARGGVPGADSLCNTLKFHH